jgi:hypothetical protein
MNERVTTTFWMDFSIADAFGKDAIQDTFNRAFEEWKSNYKYLTELVMVLNHKCWDWYEKNDTYCNLYSDLFYQARDYAYDNLQGEELEFFYHVTD